MRPKALVLLAAMFLAALGLLLLAPAGYRKLGEMSSLEARAAALRRDFPEIEHLSADTLAWLLDSGAAVLLVDVRSREEFEAGHLPGAVHLETPDAVEAHHSALDPPPAFVVLYGSTGRRSAALAAELHRRGLVPARNLAGSAVAWANRGGTLLAPSGAPEGRVLPFRRWEEALLAPPAPAESPAASADSPPEPPDPGPSRP